MNKRLKIILANKYFYIKGGSERAFFDEARILREHGHEVAFFSMDDEKNLPSPQSRYFVDRVEYNNPLGLREKISHVSKLLYSFEAKKKITDLISQEKPDLVHLHNIHHQLSPSIIHAVKKKNIPIVMTLHDYKMVCPVYTLVRGGQICEECGKGRYYRCIVNRCTKDSFYKSLINMAEMYLHHRILNIYDLVDIFISPSYFLKEKMKAMGFDRTIITLPNSLDDRLYEPEYNPRDDPVSLCFFGRLSALKGLFTLIEAMKGLDAELKIIGDGPLKDELEKKINADKKLRIKFLGYKSGNELKTEIRKCSVVIVPSEWYENYPYTIVESFGLGKPVVASRTGGIPELVKDYETGLTYNPGDIDDLHAKLLILLRDRSLRTKMGKQARQFVEENLTFDKHYQGLMKIYKMALDR